MIMLYNNMNLTDIADTLAPEIAKHTSATFHKSSDNFYIFINTEIVGFWASFCDGYVLLFPYKVINSQMTMYPTATKFEYVNPNFAEDAAKHIDNNHDMGLFE